MIISLNYLYKFRSYFENLANETIYEIFEYLDHYDTYHSFSHLNHRFKNLIIKSNLLIQINISSSIAKTVFINYYNKLIVPHRHRINYLHSSNPFVIDMIFMQSCILFQFTQLKILILENLDDKSFSNIAFELNFLPKLHTLSLNFTQYIQCPSIIFSRIFDLSELKTCKLTYKEKDNYRSFYIRLTNCDCCNIQSFEINTRFPLGSFESLLSCLPKLRYLSINSLVYSEDFNIDEELSIGNLENLKSISLHFDTIGFNYLENFIQNYFYHIEILQQNMIHYI